MRIVVVDGDVVNVGTRSIGEVLEKGAFAFFADARNQRES